MIGDGKKQRSNRLKVINLTVVIWLPLGLTGLRIFYYYGRWTHFFIGDGPPLWIYASTNIGGPLLRVD
jgi:hypothetical protein